MTENEMRQLDSITDSMEKTLMLGKIEGRRRRGQRKIRWLNGTSGSVDVGLSKFWESVMDKCCSPWGLRESDRTERLN